VTVDRQRGSSQQSVHFAAAGLVAGQYDLVVAGGVESMSRVPMGAAVGDATPFSEPFIGPLRRIPQSGPGAEMIADRWGFSRHQCDEYSVASHEKARPRCAEGRFDVQNAPVTTPDGTVVSQDEGIRQSAVEKLGTRKTAFKEDGVITAGNSRRSPTARRRC
jgi:acetyl-CoA acyltransferase